MGVAGEVLISQLNQLSWKQWKSVFQKQGYKFFEQPFDMNVFGVRNSIAVAGEFDDAVGVIYRNERLNPEIRIFKATTDPSAKALQNPINPKGTLIMLKGQYPSSHKLGFHGYTSKYGKYPALEQIGDIKYVRDFDKNNILSLSTGFPTEGNFKTNIHRASKWKILDRIGAYSYGCQVLQSPWDFDKFMETCQLQQEKIGIDTFTYSLFELDDVRDVA